MEEVELKLKALEIAQKMYHDHDDMMKNAEEIFKWLTTKTVTSETKT